MTRATVRSPLRLVLIRAGILALLATPARAHVFTITEALAILKTDGTYQIDLTVDCDALALGVSSTTDSAALVQWLHQMTPEEFDQAVEKARRTILRRVRVRFDGVKQTPTVRFPEHGTPLAAKRNPPTVLGVTARLSGMIPPGATEFRFGASRAFNAVHLTILEQATASGVKHMLGVSEDSPPFRIGQAAQTVTRGQVALEYLRLGFEHIVPKGFDHMLFVLGLFLLSTRLRPLLLQVTSFTVAHSLTLALSMYGVVSLPPRLVETLIALSIAYVAVENLFTSELKPWRPALVFAFGLLHGLGFAGVLRELGLPRAEFATALVTFNLGVEGGQLAVITLAFLAVGWMRKKDSYRRRVVVPLSILIALVGAYWAIQRMIHGV